MNWGPPFITWMTSGWTRSHGIGLVLTLLIVLVLVTIAIARVITADSQNGSGLDQRSSHKRSSHPTDPQ